MTEPIIHTALTIIVRDTLIRLTQANDQFKHNLLQDFGLKAWTIDHENPQQAREFAAKAVSQITYSEAQSRQKTTKCIGIIGISLPTYQAGLELNEAKDAFKAAIMNYRTTFGQSMSMHHLSSQQIRQHLLGHLKLQDLHFVQTYRHLKLFRTPPTRIRFSWASAHTGSVQLTKQKAIEYLKNKFTPSKGLQIDIEQLESLPDYSKIAIKRNLTSHLRANLTWPDEIEKAIKINSIQRPQYPTQINTPLPIFICLENEQVDFPEFNHIKPLEDIEKGCRLKRKDSYTKQLNSQTNSLNYRIISDKAPHKI